MSRCAVPLWNRRARTTQTEEELQAQLEQLRQQQDELSQQLGGVRVQLEKTQNCVKNRRTLTDQIEKQQQEHRRWASLSELIGSADGTKFSRFAQSLTLAHLVNLGEPTPAETLRSLSAAKAPRSLCRDGHCGSLSGRCRALTGEPFRWRDLSG